MKGTGSTIPGIIAPASLLAVGVALLQSHSIQFWIAVAGPLAGWGWSLLLEGIALWLWYRGPLALRTVALVATLVLLAGPLHQLWAPVAQEAARAEQGAAAAARDAKLLREEIAALQGSLDTYLANSRERVGWAARIDETRDALANRRDRLREVGGSAASAASRLPWQRWWVLILSTLALVLAQTSNVVAVVTLSRRFNSPAAAPAPVPEQPPAPQVQPEPAPAPVVQSAPVPAPDSAPAVHPVPAPAALRVLPGGDLDELTIRRLQEVVRSRIAASGLSPSAWAARNGVEKRDLLFFLKHHQRVRDGLPTISKPKLRELLERFARQEEAAP